MSSLDKGARSPLSRWILIVLWLCAISLAFHFLADGLHQPGMPADRWACAQGSEQAQHADEDSDDHFALGANWANASNHSSPAAGYDAGLYRLPRPVVPPLPPPKAS